MPTNTRVNATFDGPMDPATVNGTTFTVTGSGNTPVAGLVLYAAVGNTATFNPAGNLAPNTQFTATVTTGATDVAGNPLAANFVWTFTTGATADILRTRFQPARVHGADAATRILQQMMHHLRKTHQVIQ